MRLRIMNIHIAVWLFYIATLLPAASARSAWQQSGDDMRLGCERDWILPPQSSLYGEDAYKEYARLFERQVGALGFQLYTAERTWPRLAIRSGVIIERSRARYIPKAFASLKGAQVTWQSHLNTYEKVNTPCPISFGIVFGSLEVAGQKAPEYSTVSADWTTSTTTFKTQNSSLSIIASRLTPALLAQVSGGTMSLFQTASDSLRNPNPSVYWRKKTNSPLRYAIKTKGRLTTGLLTSENPDIPTDGLDTGWLLFWAGADAANDSAPLLLSNGLQDGYPRTIEELNSFGVKTHKADAPILILFDRRPQSIKTDSVKLNISFPQDKGSIAVVAPFGEQVFDAAETEKWLRDFPSKIETVCDKWSDRLAQVPVAVTESYAYDAETDTALVTQTFEFKKFRNGGTKCAPVPPMLALSISEKLPAKISKDYIDTGHLTYAGPYFCVENADTYTWSLPQLSKLVNSRPQFDSTTADDSALLDLLNAEVAKLPKDELFAPWLWGMSGRGELYFTNPAETQYLLAELLPVLDTQHRDIVLDYMKRVQDRFPLLTTAFQSVENGARRENFNKYPTAGYHHYGKLKRVPLYNVYAYQRYLQAVNLKPTAQDLRTAAGIFTSELAGSDWATLAWHYGRWPDNFSRFPFNWYNFASLDRWYPVRASKWHIAGLIGLIRMAEAAGDNSVIPQAYGRLARTLALEYAMARYVDFHHHRGLMQYPEDPHWQHRLWKAGRRGHGGLESLPIWDWQGLASDIRTIMTLDQYGATIDDVGGLYFQRMLFNYLDLTPEVARFHKELLADKARNWTTIIEQDNPAWYLAYQPISYGRECGDSHPYDPYQTFLMHAWVNKAAPEQLARYVDTPWTPRGDLYYMHKLAETIKAYRQIRWK